jgi:hypothetical protein
MTVQLEDHSRLMGFRRRLTHVLQWKLPEDFTRFQVAVFAVTLAGLAVLSLPFVRATGFHVWLLLVYVLVPVGTAYHAGKPLPDARSPEEWALAHLWYCLEPRHSVGFRPIRERLGAARFVVTVWHRRPARGDGTPLALPELDARPGPGSGNGHGDLRLDVGRATGRKLPSLLQWAGGRLRGAMHLSPAAARPRAHGSVVARLLHLSSAGWPTTTSTTARALPVAQRSEGVRWTSD